jgi:MraZ protein
MVDFLGSYDCTVDSKGRIIVPAPLKRQLLPFADKKFVVKRSVFSPCLELYVMEEWNKQRMMVGKLSPFKKKNKDFVRAFFAGIKEVELDTTGRILLAKDLLSYSGISKDVTMASAGNIIEIWDKALYENTITDTNLDFGDLAEVVMKDIDIPLD